MLAAGRIHPVKIRPKHPSGATPVLDNFALTMFGGSRFHLDRAVLFRDLPPGGDWTNIGAVGQLGFEN
jgi:hypothetical protein